MKKRMNFWDILAWIVLAGILLWVILKAFGIINIPDLLTYSPLFGAVYLAGWAMHKLKIVSEDVSGLKVFAKETANEINNIKINCLKNHS